MNIRKALSDSHHKLKKDVYIKTQSRRVVLLDLDLTLFDYSSIRNETAKKVISSLNLSMTDSNALNLYEWIVNHAKAFRAIGFPDFRRFWNSPQLYRALMALSEMDKSSLLRFYAEIEELEDATVHVQGGNENEGLEISQFKYETKEFLEINERIRKEKSQTKIIRRAVREFDALTVKIPLYSDAEDFIKSLHYAGIEQYVVTEGAQEVQMEKFGKLNLQRLIGVDKALVVGQKNSNTILRVLKTIQDHPDNPRIHFEEYSNHKKSVSIQTETIKLGVVGDRYEKDIAPFIELFGKDVITVRLLCGKYAHEYTTEYLRRKKLPLPSLVTSNLLDVNHFLLNEETWNKIDPIDLTKGEMKK